MLRTSIILAMEGRRPIDLKGWGLAKNVSVAKWIFVHCGWGICDGVSYPCLQYEIGREEWPEGDFYFPTKKTELFSLGSRLIMN